jgi:hypothetical protein
MVKLFRRLLNFLISVWVFTDTQERVRVLANKVERQQRKMQEENEELRREIHGREIFLPITHRYNHDSDVEYLKFIGGLYHDPRFIYFMALIREKMVQVMLQAAPSANEICKGKIQGAEFIYEEVRSSMERATILNIPGMVARNGK